MPKLRYCWYCGCLLHGDDPEAPGYEDDCCDKCFEIYEKGKETE